MEGKRGGMARVGCEEDEDCGEQKCHVNVISLSSENALVQIVDRVKVRMKQCFPVERRVVEL